MNQSGAVTVLDFAGFSSNFNKLLRFPGDPAGVTAAAGEGEWLLTPPARPADVNRDGAVTARDALDVIDALDAAAKGQAVSLVSDVNLDGRLTAADALFVINRIEQASPAWAEDEPTVDELLSDLEFLAELF